MAARVKESGKNLRPHVKAHKCAEIAKRQIASGAIGMCCATVSEAEMRAAAGITGLLVTSPVADPIKMSPRMWIEKGYPYMIYIDRDIPCTRKNPLDTMGVIKLACPAAVHPEGW